MRYLLYLCTLALVFTAGMLVSNLYIPDHNTSEATAVSVPDVQSNNPILQQLTPQEAQHSIEILDQALSACPIVVSAEKERLLANISLFLALKDFQVKKAIYEAEIAKNVIGTRTTTQFSRAAEDYTEAKQQIEQLIGQLFPTQIVTPTETPAQPTESPEQSSAAGLSDSNVVAPDAPVQLETAN